MTVASIPAENLYFAFLPRPFSRGRARKEELRLAFEPTIPGGFEAVRPVYFPLEDGRVLAIGVPDAAIAELPPGVVAAHPEAWPAELEAELPDLDATGINILTGPVEPVRVRRARLRLSVHALIAVLFVGAMTALVLQQRIDRARSGTQAVYIEASRVRLEALGPSAAGTRQPPASLMTSELRKLRATRAVASTESANTDADARLAVLLEVWPATAEAQAESISVAPRSIEIIATVPTLAHAETLMGALRTVPGTTAGGESTTQDRDRVRVTVRLNREGQP